MPPAASDQDVKVPRKKLTRVSSHTTIVLQKLEKLPLISRRLDEPTAALNAAVQNMPPIDSILAFVAHLLVLSYANLDHEEYKQWDPTAQPHKTVAKTKLLALLPDSKEQLFKYTTVRRCTQIYFNLEFKDTASHFRQIVNHVHDALVDAQLIPDTSAKIMPEVQPETNRTSTDFKPPADPKPYPEPKAFSESKNSAKSSDSVKPPVNESTRTPLNNEFRNTSDFRSLSDTRGLDSSRNLVEPRADVRSASRILADSKAAAVVSSRNDNRIYGGEFSRPLNGSDSRYSGDHQRSAAADIRHSNSSGDPRLGIPASTPDRNSSSVDTRRQSSGGFERPRFNTPVHYRPTAAESRMNGSKRIKVDDRSKSRQIDDIPRDDDRWHDEDHWFERRNRNRHPHSLRNDDENNSSNGSISKNSSAYPRNNVPTPTMPVNSQRHVPQNQDSSTPWTSPKNYTEYNRSPKSSSRKDTASRPQWSTAAKIITEERSRVAASEYSSTSRTRVPSTPNDPPSPDHHEDYCRRVPVDSMLRNPTKPVGGFTRPKQLSEGLPSGIRMVGNTQEKSYLGLGVKRTWASSDRWMSSFELDDDDLSEPENDYTACVRRNIITVKQVEFPDTLYGGHEAAKAAAESFVFKLDKAMQCNLVIPNSNNEDRSGEPRPAKRPIRSIATYKPPPALWNPYAHCSSCSCSEQEYGNLHCRTCLCSTPTNKTVSMRKIVKNGPDIINKSLHNNSQPNSWDTFLAVLFDQTESPRQFACNSDTPSLLQPFDLNELDRAINR